MERLIGRFTGNERGPLLVCFGGIHGNEPAGVKALDLMIKMLEVEPIRNPAFKYKGRIVGLIGNTEAFKNQERFIDQDLNRSFNSKRVSKLISKEEEPEVHEEKEILELVECVKKEIEDYNPEKLFILDLHTTSGADGIFSICTEEKESIDIAIGLHAPVVLGMLSGIKGTTLHYFNKQNIGIDTTVVTFESGQHEDPLSINRAIAGITNYMRAIGSVKAEHVENRHDQILIDYSKGLPKVTKLVLRYDISASDDFVMLPNFRNFQKVSKGELLAHDLNGPVFSPASGRILMPLYQKRGKEGFFLVQEMSGF